MKQVRLSTIKNEQQLFKISKYSKVFWKIVTKSKRFVAKDFILIGSTQSTRTDTLAKRTMVWI